MSNDAPVTVLCNGAESLQESTTCESKILNLNYLGTSRNIRIGLPDFVRNVYHLPPRVLDLLELAAYVYCADRKFRRGSKDNLEYHSWARSFHFVVKVRDDRFWKQDKVSRYLSNVLEFMTGDREYRFTFQSGHSTPPTNLFDSKQFHLEHSANPSVVLFSGGLDSLAGTIQQLEQTSNYVCLVSHQSQPGTIRTQNKLFEALKDHYPRRLAHYKFRCNLHRIRAREETQRARAFLYTSIACAIIQAFKQECFFVYENGITSMNFARREDMANARASRTTHPQTIFYLQELFSLILGKSVQIETPFLWKTKTDVVADLRDGPHLKLLPSSVSCSQTFRNRSQATHCGGCSQCIDRRFAAYASKVNEWDGPHIYETDIIAQNIPENKSEIKTTAVDYVRQAQNFGTWNIDRFYQKMASELSELVDYLPDCSNENQVVERVYCLCRRHGQQVEKGMLQMRDRHENLYQNLPKDSLLKLISDREYLKNPVARMVTSIQKLISDSIPKMFSTHPPQNEDDLNIKLSALFDSHKLSLRREHPVVSFAGGHTVPDHGSDTYDILLEAKYIRSGTTPSKASEGMAADLTKYPQESHILFVVYDPEHAIKDDLHFKDDFESQGRCTVLILR